MALQPVPVLGLDGWVNTPSEKMDNLFMHFVEANHSQTTLSRGYTYSFQYILELHRHDKDGLASRLQRDMTSYFQSYYSSASCEITVIENPAKTSYILRIFLKVTDIYGKEHNLARVSSDVNSKTVRWSNLNNYGDENQFAT